MFESGALLFLMADTPLHAGSGRELGTVDLPLQRERYTRYPVVHGSSFKGMLRAAVAARAKESDGLLVRELFGPDKESASDHAGALSVGDARVLLFPVRSLAGVYGWVTSVDVLARLQRDARILGIGVPWQLPASPGEGEALTTSNALVVDNGQVVLEELTFRGRDDRQVKVIAQWLADNAVPEGDEMAYWREAVQDRLAVLSSDAFRDFTLFATEVVTRVRLDSRTKTVDDNGLWTEENLPADTVLYAPVMVSPSRHPERTTPAHELLERLVQLGIHHVQLGGHVTIGRGVATLRFVRGGR